MIFEAKAKGKEKADIPREARVHMSMVDVFSLEQAGVDADKRTVVYNFEKRLQFYKRVKSVVFCVNGHG